MESWAKLGLEEIRRIVARVAGEVAGFLRDRSGRRELLEVRVVHRGDEGMAVDVEAEEFALELLEAEGFEGVFVGEELGSRRIGEGSWVAVVDPLDGSRNYAAGIPWAATSIALASRGAASTLADVVAGAVAPIAYGYSVYSFARGAGAYEGASLFEAPRISMPLSMLVLSYFETLEQAKSMVKYLEVARSSSRRGRSVRSLGSASLELIWAATGRVEAFIDLRGKLRVVDVAASMGFAREAGAKICVENPSVGLLDGYSRVGVVATTRYEYAWQAIERVLAGKKCVKSV